MIYKPDCQKRRALRQSYRQGIRANHRRGSCERFETAARNRDHITLICKLLCGHRKSRNVFHIFFYTFYVKFPAIEIINPPTAGPSSEGKGIF